MQQKPKIIVVLGPTASGKSDLAVDLAKKYNGEVISADSRQVYRGLDLGSGKITKKEMRGVPHHLLDVVAAREEFSVADFQKKADKAISDILKRGKLPIVAGGTGFYIQSIVEGFVLPEVPPNKKLRARLEKMPLDKLQGELKKIDKKRHNEIDLQNPVRVIRAIEIAKKLGKTPKVKNQSKYNCLQIGLTMPASQLADRIALRLEKRLRAGMLDEAKNLHKKRLSWKRMEALGLEYRFMAQYLQGKISREEMCVQIRLKSQQFAKRQMTWFKRDKNIYWINPMKPIKLESRINKFLN